MGAEPDYSDEIAKEIDDEIRRVIEESHDKATQTLREHMEELHKLSAILIERETVDREQFERLLAGEDEESVFVEEVPETPEPEPEAEADKKPALKPSPRAVPGAAMQPPPDPAAS
jgi:cell division protease FtsH